MLEPMKALIFYTGHGYAYGEHNMHEACVHVCLCIFMGVCMHICLHVCVWSSCVCVYGDVIVSRDSNFWPIGCQERDCTEEVNHDPCGTACC